MGWQRQIGRYSGWVGFNRLCLLILEDGPDVLQLIEGCFTEVGWHGTFERVFQLAGLCYYPVLGCDVRIGGVFVLVKHCGQDSCGPGVLHLHYP